MNLRASSWEAILKAYTSCCKDKDQDITVADCQILLVYLGAGIVWDTKLVATASKKKSPPQSNLKLPLSSDEYSPPSTPVYDLAIKRHCTRSMGLVVTESSQSSSSSESEPEPELSSFDGQQPASEPEVPKPKPKHHGHPRKPRIIKEKVYKICRGTRMTWRRRTLCGKQFPKQRDLNCHTVEDHKYRFLCSRHTCKKTFSSKSALDIHLITHNPPTPPFHVSHM